MSARSVRIHRWADAPDELRLLIDPTGSSTAFDWLAIVPPERKGDELGVDWVDVVTLDGPGDRIVAGRNPPPPPAPEEETT